MSDKKMTFAEAQAVSLEAAARELVAKKAKTAASARASREREKEAGIVRAACKVHVTNLPLAKHVLTQLQARLAEPDVKFTTQDFEGLVEGFQARLAS
ncbi:hypothetical protein JQC91_08760 [Jannaschia sp. Os4]|uniref:hypothetical protein n=1 Tax=Jannaschia sp. Os4 TaxID=2807617 RepID=UPI00193A40D3|nr:hypothetical protein [Jannaschia sp. Os4]MBM2576397.1 hypothetical protein [Jannaschia sp. Os4]